MEVIKYAIFELYYNILDWLIGVVCFIAKQSKEATMRSYETGKITRAKYVEKVKRFEKLESLRTKLQASRS